MDVSSTSSVVLIVAEYFPPVRNSAAIQLGDLVDEIGARKHPTFVVTPDHTLCVRSSIEFTSEFVTILRVRVPDKSVGGRLRRFLVEFLVPFYLALIYFRHYAKNYDCKLIVWYSPTIFMSPFVWLAKKYYGGQAYLILRDFFPDWAVDTGLIRPKSFVHYLMKTFEYLQYYVADYVGVQSESSVVQIDKKIAAFGGKCRTELLENWLNSRGTSFSESSTSYGTSDNEQVFIYAGNIGVAQNLDLLLDAAKLIKNVKAQIMLVGNGMYFEHIMARIVQEKLSNVVLREAVEPSQLSKLYDEAVCGLVVLDPRHTTHNIPGKFLSYMHYGLPVLAIVNKGNDLVKLIKDNVVGKVVTSASASEIAECIDSISSEPFEEGVRARCLDLAKNRYSTGIAVNKLLEKMENIN